MDSVQRILPKCPKCGRYYGEQPAISREDNKTKICSMCGIQEAMDAWSNWQNKS